MTGDPAVLVLDGGNRVVRFGLRASGIVHVGDLILEMPGRDISALGDKIFVQGLHNGYGVHEIDRTGRIVRPFHPAPEDVGFDRWMAAVPDYRPIEPVLTPDGGQTWDRGDGSDHVVSMEDHPAGVLVVQTVHVAPGDDFDSVQPTTCMVDAGSAEIGLVESDVLG